MTSEIDELPDLMEWQQERLVINGVETRTNGRPKSEVYDHKPGRGTLGLVVGGDLDGYLREYKCETIEIPEYYSQFPDGGYLAEGEPSNETDTQESILRAKLVRAAIRTLAGKGRYSASAYTLYDCLPNPCVLRREDGMALLIAPGVDTDWV